MLDWLFTVLSDEPLGPEMNVGRVLGPSTLCRRSRKECKPMEVITDY
jgi:hypothetical protein